MRIRMFFLIVVLLPMGVMSQAQDVGFEPGFNSREYLAMLQMAFTKQDSLVEGSAEDANADGGHVMDSMHHHVAPPADYVRRYHSPEVGLKNKWDMWYRKDNRVAVINIRGTINDAVSWLANFYSAMVPATGSLQLNDSMRFTYQLSTDEKAMVHVGWLVSLGYMAPTMVEQIKVAYAKGIRDFFISGHSQGGAIAFMTTSYLHYLIVKGELPADIHFKTYCSAAPKPGNLYYAYDYEFITRGGWSMTVVNAADWVPESPFSIQALADYNPANPFVHINGLLKKQPWLIRWYLKGKYNKMDRLTRKAARYYKSTLGGLIYKQVKKSLRQLKEPAYSDCYNYQRAGVPVVLEPDAAYYQQFGNDPQKVFQHHMYEAYVWLVHHYYGE